MTTPPEPVVSPDDDPSDVDPSDREFDGDLESYQVYADDGAPFEVDVGSAQFSVADMVKKIARKQVELAPDYQRNDVWDVARRSWFIESVILNIPLPPVYLNQRTDGSYVVIDGKQRLSTLRDFLAGAFALTKLPRCVAFNGKKWADLPPAVQARIEDRQIACHVLKPSVKIELVYEIFHRINRGGVPLNRQEIRNGLLQGPATELLQQLAAILGGTGVAGNLASTRMKDQELALRCIAFQWKGPDNYRGDMDGFLTDAMRELNRSSDEFRKAIRGEFLLGMGWCAAFFGETMFRLPAARSSPRLNIAFAEAAYRFVCANQVWNLDAADRIKANHAALVWDEGVRNLCSWNTGNPKRLVERFTRIDAALREGVC